VILEAATSRTLLSACSLGLVLSFGLAACATLKLPSTVVGDIPQVSAAGTASEPAASTALVVKSPQKPVDVARKAEKSSPRSLEENGTGNPDSEDILPPDRATSVYFPLGSYSFDREAEAAIKTHAEKLVANPLLSVALVGHTDDLGSKEYNDALCIKRAGAVKQALLDLGVASRQIRLSIRYGYETAPPKPCLTDACRKRLRRVEVRYDSMALSH